jgi:cell division protein FtsZ
MVEAPPASVMPAPPPVMPVAEPAPPAAVVMEAVEPLVATVHAEGELPLPPPVAPAAAPTPSTAMPQAALRSTSSHDWRLSQRPAARPSAAPRGDAARSPNIFQRITGLVGGGRPPAPPAGPPVEPVIATRPAEPPPAPTPLRPVTTSAQPKIAGLDPGERTKTARDEDDLQIPAFLRRQAN